MKVRLIYLLLISFFWSCKGSKQPELEIPQAKLIPLLVDLGIARSGNAVTSLKDSIPDEHLNRILALHQVTRAQLDHDLKILSTQPLLSEKIYTGVLDSLNTPR